MVLFHRILGAQPTSESPTPLVVLHGLLGSSDNWQALGSRWADHRPVVLIDQRNHGRSPHHPSHGYPDMVVDLLITLDQHPDSLTLARDYPNLKIVLNHAYSARMTDGQLSDEWKRAVSETSQHPNVYMKISRSLNFAGVAKPAPNDLDHYRDILDHCYDSFGEDRVIFGTNWGVCTHWGSVDNVVRIVEEFLAPKGEVIARKAMRDNAMRVYGISPEKVRK